MVGQLNLEHEERLLLMKKRKKARRRVSVIILILCLLLVFNIETIVGAIRGTLYLGHMNIHPIASISYNSGVKINEGNVVQLAGNRLIKAEGGKLQYMDREGLLLWEKPYAGSKVIVKAVDKVIYIVEKDSGDFYILDQQGGIKAKKEALGKIDRVIAEDSDYAILYKQLERKIAILGADGIEKAVVDLPYPDILDIAYVPASKLIAVSVFFVEKDTFHTNVLLFGIDGKMKGARNFDEQILFKITGVKDRLIGIGDTLAVAFNGEKESIWKVPFDRTVAQVAVNPAGYTAYNLVIENREISDTRDENVIMMVSPEGDIIFEKAINVVVDRIEVREDRIAILGDGKVQILDKKGRVLGIHTIEGNLKQMLWIDRDRLGLEYEDHFEIMSCKY